MSLIEERVCQVVELQGGEVRRALGSGYFVRPDRVLTAQHVLDGAAALAVLRVGELAKPLPAQCIWPRKPTELDLAVLKVGSVPGLPGVPPELAWGRLPWTGRWKAAGFPEAGDLVGGLHFGGDDYGHGLGTTLLQLDVRTAPAEAAKWGGASGSAVFAADRLIGVVVSQVLDFEGQKLLATPLYEAIGERDFLLALGVAEERLRRRDQVIERVAELLGASPRAARALAAARIDDSRLVSDWQVFLEPAFEPRAFAQHLCELATLEDLFDAFNRAFQAAVPEAGPRRARLSAEEAVLADALEGLLSAIAPLVRAASLVITLPSGQGGIVQLPVCTETLAEIALAGLEGRSFSFEPLGSATDRPHPRALLRPPQETDERGFDLDGTQRLVALLKANQDLLPIQDRDRLPKKPAASLDELKPALDFFDVALVNHARRLKDPLRPFLLLGPLTEAKDQSFVRLLQEHLPALRLLEATGSDHRGERQLCGPLQEFLFHAFQIRRAP